MAAMGLSFSLFGIPFEVKASLAALLLLPALFLYSTDYPLWAAAVVGVIFTAMLFVSVLVHELGHAFEARRAGAYPTVTLLWFGGLTRYGHHGLSSQRQIWIVAAGVFYQAVVSGAVWGAMWLGLLGQSELAGSLVSIFVFINVFLIILNLIPPLDGGMILGHALELLRVPRPHAVMVVVYLLGAVALLVWTVSSLDWLGTLIVVFITWVGIKTRVEADRYERDRKQHRETEAQIRRTLLGGDPGAAVDDLKFLVTHSRSSEYRLFNINVLLLAARLADDHDTVHWILDGVDPKGVSPTLAAAAYEAIDRDADALDFLTAPASDREPAGTAVSLAERYIAAGRFRDATALVEKRPRYPAALLATLDIHRKVCEAGATWEAARLRDRVTRRSGTHVGHVAHMLITEQSTNEAVSLARGYHERHDSASSAGWLGFALLRAGRREAANTMLDLALDRRLPVESAYWLHRFLEWGGDHEWAARVGQSILDRALPLEWQNVIPYNVACSLALAGRQREALELLANVNVDLLMLAMPQDDDLESVRADFAYAELVDSLATT